MLTIPYSKISPKTNQLSDDWINNLVELHQNYFENNFIKYVPKAKRIFLKKEMNAKKIRLYLKYKNKLNQLSQIDDQSERCSL